MINRRLMLILVAGATLAASLPSMAQSLPDLGGKEVIIVTENAYPPLQFVDPKVRQSDRLGI